MWRRDLRGGRVHGLVVDARNRVIAAGFIGTDLRVVVFNGASGRSAGWIALNGTENSFDYGFDVAVRGRDVVVVGSVSNRNVSSDFTIASFRLR